MIALQAPTAGAKAITQAEGSQGPPMHAKQRKQKGGGIREAKAPKEIGRAHV